MCETPVNRNIWLAVVPVLLLTAALGALQLNDTLWYDEIFTLQEAGARFYGPYSPADVWRQSAATEPNNPPGYHLLVNLWGALAGWTPLAGRTLSLLAGVLAVAALYRLGRDLASPAAALGAALALGASAVFAHYLHELRTYTLVVLVTVVMLLAYWRILTAGERPCRAAQALLALAVAGAAYTHYLALLIPLSLGLYQILFVREARVWRRTAIPALAGGLPFLPWLGVMERGVTQTIDMGGRAIAMPAGLLLLMLAYAFSNGLIVPALIAGGAAIGHRARGARLIWFLAGTLLALALLVNAVTPLITHVRYLLILWPPLALIAGLGLDRLWAVPRRRWLALAVAAAWVTAGVWYALDPTLVDILFYNNDRGDLFRRHLPLNEMTRALQAEASAGDVLVFHSPAPTWPISDVIEYDIHDLGLHKLYTDWLTHPPGQGEDFGTAAESFLGQTTRAWLALERRPPPDPYAPALAAVQDVLAADFALCTRVVDRPGLSLDLYARAPACCCTAEAEAAPPLARFGEGIALTHLDPLPPVVGGDHALLIGWRLGENVPPYTYSLAVHLYDSLGDLAAQVDTGLPLDRCACQQVVLPTGDLLPGEYRAMLMVYDWQTGARLPVTRPNGRQSERLLLGQVIVRGRER